MPHAIRYFLILSLLSMPLVSANAAKIGVEVTFSHDETVIIRAYFDDERNQSSKKAKGKKSLPPGIEKNLARGKALPPGIAKQLLPADLVRLLPPARDGYERITVSGKVLLVEIATQLIHDVLEDVILR
jgi:hypothetical protein